MLQIEAASSRNRIAQLNDEFSRLVLDAFAEPTVAAVLEARDAAAARHAHQCNVIKTLQSGASVRTYVRACVHACLL